jgi:integrase
MSSDRIPRASRHRTGQAVVRLSGRDHYLGRYGSREARAAYEALIARWLANGRSLPDQEAVPTVNDVLLAYVQHAESYYAGGERSTELGCIKDALSIVKALWGRTPAREFGPKRLKAVREKMLDRGWCRSYVNHEIDRVRRVFRWAVEEELLSGEVYHALQALRGIRRGMPDVRESEPVKPVPQAFVDAALPHMLPPVAAMVQLQLLTAMRPGEACAMRGCHIDVVGHLWTYRPPRHKTAHHGKEREVLLGPRAQEVIRPFLKLDVQAPLFSPPEAIAAQAAQKRRQRKTPLWPSHIKHQAAKRKKTPQRQPKDCYTPASYRRAIARACVRAGVPEWHPHQLRHNAATTIRKEFGIELTRVILGHSSLAITAIYAETDQQAAREVVARIG